MGFADGRLSLVDRPETEDRQHNGPPSKAGLLLLNVRAKFKPGERLVYSADLGAAKKTYYDWLPVARD